MSAFGQCRGHISRHFRAGQNLTFPPLFLDESGPDHFVVYFGHDKDLGLLVPFTKTLEVRRMASAGALARGLRGLGCWGALLMRLGAGTCQQPNAIAAFTAAAASWAPPPTARPSAAQRWCRAYSTPAMEAWDSLRQSFSTIKVEAGDDGVATITIDRPQALNALNSQVQP
jgi:hypothetical protein